MSKKNCLDFDLLREQREFTKDIMREFAKVKCVNELTFQSDDLAISLRKNTKDNVTKVTGFAIGGEEDIDEEVYDNDGDEEYGKTRN